MTSLASQEALDALRRKLTAPSLEETICRHLHPLEWSAPTPRVWPCEPCNRLGRAIRIDHGGQP